VREQVGHEEQVIGAVLRSAINGVASVKWFAPLEWRSRSAS
jgi:hypothetical protein